MTDETFDAPAEPSVEDCQGGFALLETSLAESVLNYMTLRVQGSTDDVALRTALHDVYQISELLAGGIVHAKRRGYDLPVIAV